MKDTSILLSISMLISGKEDMEKSLKSLLYFKEAFPCEIILVDTGCDARQRALAEQYADKIVDFEWCNDFAAARNAGLKEVQGEWFLYLDDDEWFDNPKEIISFFQSGEYKEYNCASYVVRNYSNLQGTMYDDSYPSRMVKLEPKTKFVGKIHEYLTPFRMPKKNFSDFVHHYGYVYKNAEEKMKHARRNIEPLLEMRKEHPGDPRWMCQLAQEYFAIAEYEKNVELCKSALSEWNKLKEYVTYAPSHVGAVYAYILISLETIGTVEALEEGIKWLSKALEEPILKMKVMEPTTAFFYLVGARLYSKLKSYELCRDCFRKYLGYYKILKDERERIEIGAATIVSGVFQEWFLYGGILLAMEALIRVEDYELAEEAFFLIGWSNRHLLQQLEHERAMVDACCSVKYHPTWVKILQTLVAREDGMKEMYVVFLEAEIRYRQNGETEKLSALRRLVSELDYEHRYILCTKILWMEEDPAFKSAEERRERAEILFGQLFEKYLEEIFQVKAEVWSVAERMELSMESELLKIDCEKWEKCAHSWSQSASLAELQQWDARISVWKTREDVRYDLFIVKCLEGYLHHCVEGAVNLEQWEKLLNQYADSVLVLHKMDFPEAEMNKTAQVFSGEIQLALLIKELQKYSEAGDELKVLECLRRCLSVYAPLEGEMAAYARLYRNEINQKKRKEQEEQAELIRLVNSLKKMAKLQLEKGECEAARNILLQIRQCMPGDTEIEELLNKTNRREEGYE